MQRERTLASRVVYDGIGLHSGKPVHIEIAPAPPRTGIQFARIDLPEALPVAATAENVTATLRATTIAAGTLKFFTIEHLMSALHVSGVDNCLVLLNAEEPPVVDGSARTFFRLIAEAGTVEQDAERRVTVIDRVYRVDDGSHFVMAVPYDGLRVSFTSLNEHPLIGVQYYDIEVTPESYGKEIAPARTIAYEKEVAALQANGLGLGGSLETVIVYNDEGWMNPLNFPNELVRHKILDVLGDIRLAGVIRGHIIAVASGHALNTALAKQIAEERKQHDFGHQ
ncbi:UDP-3-O-acyl-N-acetylglucosamine deacetylase [Selenomonas massiliensis]|uniref:UDP-3-O-acyl-N-acetylglucosamine deacetylase n=1 Tax=Selenomonas massiliensis TaxID=2058293 RepID=UPI000D10F272|nr:UDP-3-O-acyl-N-acetylglucosamine deacetylase [Selenomonas massiliensis]